MPVNVLYCEGNSRSYDIRLIRQLLPKCEIRPLGGKQFMTQIIADRTINPNLAGLVDRDFSYYDFTPTDTPIPYNYQGMQVGWMWQRKEIENYLLDPVVVERALGRKAPPMDEYQEAIDEAKIKISTYTAARTALAYFKFQNSWGDPIKGVFGSTHFFPKRLKESACRENLREIVQKNKGDRIVTSNEVLSKFNELLPSFQADGFYFEHYLTFFAGKDLLWMMRSKLTELGFDSPTPDISSIAFFLEKIISRIERAEEVWTWLPEWQNLREAIINTNFES